MEYLIGVVLALAISIGASAIGMDRERSFYPTVLAVVATYYALFAVMAGSTHALLSEAVPIAVFLLAAATGFKKALWWVVIGLVAHGLFDVRASRLDIESRRSCVVARVVPVVRRYGRSISGVFVE